MRHYRICMLAACCLFIPKVVFAYAIPNINKTNELPGYPPVPQYNIGGFTVDGYAAASYNYLSQSDFFTSNIASRSYDADPNGFILNQIGVDISKLPTEGLGGLVNMMLGRDTNSLQTYGMPPALDSQNAGFVVQQAFLQYAFHSVTVTAGKFYTLAGLEEVPSPFNTHYSSSLLAFFAEPTTHVGLRATYAMNQAVTLIAGINDGWDNIRDWSRRKTLELGSAYKNEKYSLSAAWYNGQERATPFTQTGPVGMRNSINIFGTMKVTDKITLAANYDFVTQSIATLPDGSTGRANWQGIAVYFNYQFNPKWRTSLRGEYFNDPDGFSTGVRQNLKELTATVGYLVFKNFELRAETRRDVSSTNAFLGKDNDSTSNNLQSFALEGVLTI